MTLPEFSWGPRVLLTLEGLGGGGGGFHRIFVHRVYGNSPMSIPVSLAPFVGQFGARFNLVGPGNVQERQIGNFEKSTYLALK